MDRFIVLENSGLMVNINKIKYIEHIKIDNTYRIVYFNLNRMGTKNPIICRDDFDVLKANLP